MRTELDDTGVNTVAVITMFRDYVKRRVSQDYRPATHSGQTVDYLAKLETEEDRVKALEKYFFIKLTPSESRAIKGLSSEIKASSKAA